MSVCSFVMLNKSVSVTQTTSTVGSMLTVTKLTIVVHRYLNSVFLSCQFLYCLVYRPQDVIYGERSERRRDHSAGDLHCFSTAVGRYLE